MIFLLSWLRRGRRRKLRARPWPEDWERICREKLAFWPYLPDADREELRDLVKVFVAEKNWEGLRGLAITDEVRVTIAAHACLLLLGIDHEYYRKVKSILVYPYTVFVPARQLQGGMIASEGSLAAHGVASYGGPVVLSWDAVQNGVRSVHDGHNVVYHEFAHKLDMLDGWVDGAPPLRSREQVRAWRRVMMAEFERLRSRSEGGRGTLLDPYGATNPGEFFAVATESFYERAAKMQKERPELFAVLQDYYGRNPAEWRAGGAFDET